MTTKKNILISAGGTGGHFFPALALFKRLKENSYKIHFITDKRCSNYISEDLKNQITVQKICKFQRSPIKLLIFALSLIFNVLKNVVFAQK